MRIKKLKKENKIIYTAARHNLREIDYHPGAAEQIDSSLSHLNVVLAGSDSANQVADLARNLITEAGITKLRKDVVPGIEILFSLPANTKIDIRKFFSDCVEWVRKYYGAPILSAIIHLDEAAPHCHVLLLPIIDGRMNGARVVGYQGKMRAMRLSFHEKVGKPYGLTLESSQKRLSATERHAAAMQIVAVLRKNNNWLNDKSVRKSLCDAIAKDPDPFIQHLELEIRTKSV